MDNIARRINDGIFIILVIGLILTILITAICSFILAIIAAPLLVLVTILGALALMFVAYFVGKWAE